jgi:two-component system, NarL family, response regulator LiaR
MDNLINNDETGSDQVKKDITVLLVDDHSLMRDSLRMHLETQPDIKVIAEASNGEDAIKLAAKLGPDIIIMDIVMPGINGLEATRIIKSANPNISVLILSVHRESEYVYKILQSGADGYLTKDIQGDQLIQAIRLVNSGESVLTEGAMKEIIKYVLRNPLRGAEPLPVDKLTTREIEILEMAARGMSNKKIATEFKLSLRTVKGHFVNIFSKMKVSSRTEAVMVGLRAGYVSLDDIGLGKQ